MSIRKEVEEFVALGPLPDESASEALITEHQVSLQRIKKPVADEEAALLVKSFGSDDCYGLAWTLVHLIESAPGGAGLMSKPTDADNEWVRRLWARSHR
jgi:hypothetical protein